MVQHLAMHQTTVSDLHKMYLGWKLAVAIAADADEMKGIDVAAEEAKETVEVSSTTMWT